MILLYAIIVVRILHIMVRLVLLFQRIIIQLRKIAVDAMEMENKLFLLHVHMENQIRIIIVSMGTTIQLRYMIKIDIKYLK